MQPGTLIDGRYLVESQLGDAVYLVRDTTLGREVVLEIVRADPQEAAAIAKLAHPNVVNVFEVTAVGERTYIALEYVPGGTLRDWLARSPRSWRAILELVVGAGRGLAAVHAAGLVHGNFTSANVLVGDDNRPRVTNFGFGAATADAKSDQVAFCRVALECLRDSGVPARPRRVLERGLARPFGDMPALIAELERAARPRVARTVAIVAVASILAGGGAIAVAGAKKQHALAACAHEADEVRRLLDDSTRAAIQRGFTATGSAYAQNAFDHSVGVLARYAEALAARAGSVCRGEGEPPRVTAARRACLATRKSELAGIVAAFGDASPDFVQRSADVAWSIFDPTPCGEPLPAAVITPSLDDASELGKLQALNRAGRPRDVVARATPLLQVARARGDRVLELELLLVLGQARGELEPASAVAPLFHQAEALGETIGRHTEAAVALRSLATLYASARENFAEAHRSIDRARAKLARLGGTNSTFEASLHMTEATLLRRENRPAEAQSAVGRGIALYAQVYGPQHPKIASAHALLSQILRDRRDYPAAVAAGRKALAGFTQAFGDDHVMVAASQMNLGAMLLAAQQIGEAREMMLRADRTYARLFGPDHADARLIAANLGQLERSEKHYDAALAAFERAHTIAQRTHGARSATYGDLERELALTLALADRLDEAAQHADRAVEIFEQLGADGLVDLDTVLLEAANIHLARDRSDLARPLAERGLALAQQRGATPSHLAEARKLVARSRAPR